MIVDLFFTVAAIVAILLPFVFIAAIAREVYRMFGGNEER